MFEESFGIIPIKKIRGVWKVLLVQHGKGHWAFPKGHAEKGETPLETAVRELFEETGLEIKELLSPTFEEHYFFSSNGKKISKTVTYFLAEVKGKLKVQEKEISDHLWLKFDDAVEKMTFSEGKRLCKEVVALLVKQRRS